MTTPKLRASTLTTSRRARRNAKWRGRFSASMPRRCWTARWRAIAASTRWASPNRRRNCSPSARRRSNTRDWPCSLRWVSSCRFVILSSWCLVILSHPLHHQPHLTPPRCGGPRRIVLSSCHLVIVLLCHRVIVSPCHRVTVSSCHRVIVSSCHRVPTLPPTRVSRDLTMWAGRRLDPPTTQSYPTHPSPWTAPSPLPGGLAGV